MKWAYQNLYVAIRGTGGDDLRIRGQEGRAFLEDVVAGKLRHY